MTGGIFDQLGGALQIKKGASGTWAGQIRFWRYGPAPEGIVGKGTVTVQFPGMFHGDDAQPITEKRAG